jgi:hypothetical protein
MAAKVVGVCAAFVDVNPELARDNGKHVERSGWRWVASVGLSKDEETIIAAGSVRGAKAKVVEVQRRGGGWVAVS